MDIKISESIEKLKQEKRILANKLLEFTQAFKNSIAKIEKKHDERFAAYDKKLAKLENDRLESATSKDCECTAQVKEVKSVVDKHSDNVSKLEKECNDTNELIRKIDENLEELDNKINVSNKIIEDLKQATTRKPEEEIKQCIFDRTGFCREKDQCMFFHTEEICDVFLEKHKCWKRKCLKRHPKICRYFQRGVCTRDDCIYLHESNVHAGIVDNFADSCDKCDNLTYQRYFCEFCSKNFCANCTSKEAHKINIYKNQENPSCSNIHN